MTTTTSHRKLIHRLARAALPAVLVAGLALGVNGCTPRVDVRGNLPDPELLEEIRAGGFGRDDVAQLLGSPSTTAMFENETWFYVSQKTQTVAFLEPEVVEQTVVVVQFENTGEVKSVDQLDLEDGRIVTPTEKVTPTLGNDLTILEQALGNLGRFNSE